MRALGLSSKRACVLGIRTGQSGSIIIPRVCGVLKLKPFGVVNALKKMATKCEAVEEELAEKSSNGKDEGCVCVVECQLGRGYSDGGVE